VKNNKLFSLGVVVFLFAIYSSPPSAIAAPAMDACPCVAAFAEPDLVTLMSPIISSAGGATSCQNNHLPGGTLGVSVNVVGSILPLGAEAGKNADGSLQCVVSIPGIATNTSAIFSMGEYNSCKRQIRQLCGDLGF
jgi:hypothetical protein